MNRDYLKAGAMVAALVTMAPAEYHLAQGCGFGQWLAAGLPASLDIYTLRALRTGRDVIAVAVVMIAVNAASHLIAAGHLAVSWYLIVAVSALPILVLVRVERLGKEDTGTAVVEAEPEVFQMEHQPEPAAVPAEPAPEPVVIERADNSTSTVADLRPALTLGPLVPVAELLAGTASDQPFCGDAQKGQPTPEPSPVPVEPSAPRVEAAPVPPEPEPEPIEVPPGVSAEHVTLARLWLKADPKLTGTAIGTRLGTSDGYGRRVKRAVLEVTA